MCLECTEQRCGLLWSMMLGVSQSILQLCCAKMTESIEVLFGVKTAEGPGNTVLNGTYVKLLWPIVRIHHSLNVHVNVVIVSTLSSTTVASLLDSYSCVCIKSNRWSARRPLHHQQSVVETSRHLAFIRGQESTMWDIVCRSPH